MSIARFAKKKLNQQKLSMVTCYDYPSAKIAAQTDIDVLLIGDSVAMVVHGFDSTVMATMEMMILHTKAVARGVGRQFIVADMPFMAHRGNLEKTVENAKQLIQAGAHAVKIEGADLYTLDAISHLVTSSIPVMGHIGLQPQSILALGAYKVQGRCEDSQKRLLQEAQALQNAGCFSVVLECVPETFAKAVTDSLIIPTIGIGAGAHTDGQVLVWHDALGLQNQWVPKFVKQYQPSESLMIQALQQYHHEVEKGVFPAREHCYE